jgi:hypothetical protein
MKEPCKKCGKKLGFLERSYKIENPKLGINYDALCGDCYSVQKKGIEKLEDIYQRMLSNLKQNKDVQKNGIDSVEIDLLILLAVEALLSIEPKFYLPETPLNQAFIRANEDRGIDRQKDIVRVVYKLLDYGFKTNLQNSDLDQIRNFIAYMIQNEVFLEDIEVNCGVKDELVKANVFISRRGVIIDTIPDQKLIFISIPKDTVVEYDVETSEIINEIIFHNLKYPWDAKKKVVLTLISENLLFSVANAMDRFNQKTTKLHEKLKKDSLEYFNSCVVADLKKIKPDEYLEAIHLDCLLLCIVKNLKNQNLFSMEALFDPKGTTIELLWAYYRRNLRNMGMDNNENIISYMLKNTLYTEGFSIKHGNKPSDKGWGFFTTKGYIIYFKRSKQVFFIYTENFPNAIYHPCSRVSYENKQYLQLIMNNGPGRVDEYRDLDELIFYSEEPETINQMERFFEKHNLYYHMDTFLRKQKEVQRKRDKRLQVQRIINHIFADFGYLPFCIYDEWFMIQRELKKSDLLLNKIITIDESKNKNYVMGSITYAPKIVEAFNWGAEDCRKSLDIVEDSVAKAMLWVSFHESITETLSQEWVRIAGEILEENDNTLSAFYKYVNLKNIEPDKVYYMGLFIYHLMDRGILKGEDFIDNYENAVKVFLECRRVMAEPKFEGKMRPVEELLGSTVEEPTEA